MSDADLYKEREREYENICWQQVLNLSAINRSFMTKTQWTLNELRYINSNIALIIRLFKEV